MDKQNLSWLADNIKKRSGIVVTEAKEYLVESRLLPIARDKGYDSVDSMVKALRLTQTEALLIEIVEAMTTNESLFFRDNKPFEKFRNMLLPYFQQQNVSTRKLRVWSSACSTGQEPYTLAMCLAEDAAKVSGWNIDIIASDLADKVVEKAKQGTFSQLEVQRGLPITMLVKYFTQDGQTWTIKPEMKRLITFRTMNLLDSYAILGKFDFILCRNVLIYFDQETKKDILTRMHGILNPGGVVMLGSSETIFNMGEHFVPFEGEASIYKRVG